MIRKPPYQPKHPGPVGPSVPLAQVYNQEPFMYAPLFMNRNMKHARGVNVVVNAAAGATVVIRHNLGRYMKGAFCMQNNGGGNYPPRIRLVTSGISTLSRQSIQAEEQCISAILWVY